MSSIESFKKRDGLKVLLTIASAVIVIAGIHAAKIIIVPVILASFLAIVSYPVTRLLKDKFRLPHWLAVTFTVIINFSFLIGIGLLTQFLAGDFNQIWQDKYNPLIYAKFDEVQIWLKDHNWEIQAKSMFDSAMETMRQPLVDMTATFVTKAFSIIAVTTLVLILMTFFLGESPRFHINAKRITKKNGMGIQYFIKALSNIQKYLIIKTSMSLITGILAWVICYVMGVDLPLLWAIIAFALNYIPTFGSIVAAIPPILLALLLLGTSEAIIVAGAYLLINFAIGNMIEPLLLGKQFGIATSVVLLSVLFWGWLLGPVGMFLAVPMSMLVKLALENSRDLNWVALLMDNPLKKPNINIPGIKPLSEKIEQATIDQTEYDEFKNDDL